MNARSILSHSSLSLGLFPSYFSLVLSCACFVMPCTVLITCYVYFILWFAFYSLFPWYALHFHDLMQTSYSVLCIVPCALLCLIWCASQKLCFFVICAISVMWIYCFDALTFHSGVPLYALHFKLCDDDDDDDDDDELFLW